MLIYAPKTHAHVPKSSTKDQGSLNIFNILNLLQPPKQISGELSCSVFFSSSAFHTNFCSPFQVSFLRGGWATFSWYFLTCKRPYSGSNDHSNFFLKKRESLDFIMVWTVL